MNYPDVEDVIKYLSIKFNKIFIDRDFVCCVIQDFQTLLFSTDKSCVLVFPALGPIYLKAVRYQAKIFDLASFQLNCRRSKITVVCHKDSLIKKSNELESNGESMKEEIMEVTTSKKKRPERELYIPPAQRRSKQSKFKTSPKCYKKQSVECDNISKYNKISNKNNEGSLLFENSEDCALINTHRRPLLSFNDIVYVAKFMNTPNLNPKIVLNAKSLPQSKVEIIELNQSVCFYSIFKLRDPNFGFSWQLQYSSLKKNSASNFQCCPIFDLDFDSFPIKSEYLKSVLINCNCNLGDFVQNLGQEFEDFRSGIYKIKCDQFSDSIFENIDFSMYKLGHCFILSYEGGEYYYQCQQDHHPKHCVDDKLEELKNKNQLLKNNQKSKTNINHSTSISNENNNKVNKTEHEQEKEIMRKVKENINRKSKPIMKYVEDRNDTLTIDKTDSINNWEDLFNDDGQIQEELLSEIVEKVGPQVKILKATEDYTAYTIKPPENLEHVVELYNFPATLETHDLVQAFRELNSDAMYIKWVDDTHALLVLGSFSQAQKAISMQNPLIKVRPMTAASSISMDVANKSDLKPAMKRPPTNLQTARRLITSHLGTKSKLSSEQMAKEKQDLRNAKEMKRLIKQSEKDAWEGNIRSTLK